MKKYLKNMLRFNLAHYISAMLLLLLWLGSNIVLTGCKKEDRLFTHIDSTAEVPSQFHFFNTFSYDDALSFAVDGLPRETVNKYTFSAYYPSSSAFNTNTGIANSKLLNIHDPANSTLYANLITNNTFQFKPNTSYIVFSTNSSYDTVYTPLKTIIPRLVYYPEDVYHPFDGTTGIRVFNCLASRGGNSMYLNVAPNLGSGTSIDLGATYTDIQPASAAVTYTNTQAGIKKLTLTVSANPEIQLSYLPVQLDNSKNYSFFAVGDVSNYLLGLQPLPKLFMTEDGKPSSLKELTISSISYPGNASTTAQVTVVNDAYNIKGLLVFGDANAGNLIQYPGLDVQLNQTKINVKRWPIYTPPGDHQTPYEDIRDSSFKAAASGEYPLNLMQRVATNSSVAPGSYLINVLPGNGFSPSYGSFNYNFQQGLAYTLCLLPDNNSSQRCSQLILQNDQSPNNKFFRLRFINIMGGTTQVDVHTGSPAGPVIASGLGYGQDNAYVNFTPNLIAQNLYITAAGSTTALFQLGANNAPISLPFTPGNSGTIYLMGLLPGTHYSGDSGSFGPYVYYNSDAYINANTVLNSSQLYY